jgi:CRP-like cAMP-binding protein
MTREPRQSVKVSGTQLATVKARANLLLAAVSEAERLRITAACEPVELAFGDVLYQQGGRIRHVYFPTGGFISLLAQVDARAGLEVGLVGTEGVVGVSVALGVGVAPALAIVQGAGSALRMEASRFPRELERSPQLRAVVSRYTYVLMSQLVQMSACTRFHLVEARLARWLLMTRDRAGADDFYLTQEFIASMLGVRRVGITRAARELQRRRFVRYSRGRMNILDVRGLESASCACYASGRDTHQRIMAPGAR